MMSRCAICRERFHPRRSRTLCDRHYWRLRRLAEKPPWELDRLAREAGYTRALIAIVNGDATKDADVADLQRNDELP